MIRFQCPLCQKEITTGEQMLGKFSHCPYCVQTIQIPMMVPASQATAEPVKADNSDVIREFYDYRREKQNAAKITGLVVIGVGVYLCSAGAAIYGGFAVLIGFLICAGGIRT